MGHPVETLGARAVPRVSRDVKKGDQVNFRLAMQSHAQCPLLHFPMARRGVSSDFWERLSSAVAVVAVVAVAAAAAAAVAVVAAAVVLL